MDVSSIVGVKMVGTPGLIARYSTLVIRYQESWDNLDRKKIIICGWDRVTFSQFVSETFCIGQSIATAPSPPASPLFLTVQAPSFNIPSGQLMTQELKN